MDTITGLAFLEGLGLAQVLLWVFTFAVVFGILTKLNIFKRASSALISMIAGVFVLMAVPASVIAVIASLSTGLIVMATAVLTLMSLLIVAGADKHWSNHAGKIAIALTVIAALIFVGAGGLSLIGIASLPSFGMSSWVLFVVGAAVLWMLYEAGPSGVSAPTKTG